MESCILWRYIANGHHYHAQILLSTCSNANSSIVLQSGGGESLIMTALMGTRKLENKLESFLAKWKVIGGIIKFLSVLKLKFLLPCLLQPTPPAHCNEFGASHISSTQSVLCDDIFLSYLHTSSPTSFLIIARVIPQSLQLQTQLTLASRSWCLKVGGWVKSCARRSVCFCSQSGRSASIGLLT